jgi:hypothetical protein
MNAVGCDNKYCFCTGRCRGGDVHQNNFIFIGDSLDVFVQQEPDKSEIEKRIVSGITKAIRSKINTDEK